MPYHPDRIDGAAEWAKLPPDVQARIGAGAIELIATCVGVDATADDVHGSVTPATRAFEAADAHCSDQLFEAVSEAVPAIDPDRPLLPASLGEVCAQCGRHHDDRHGEGCPWSSPGPDTATGDEPAAPGIPSRRSPPPQPVGPARSPSPADPRPVINRRTVCSDARRRRDAPGGRCGRR